MLLTASSQSLRERAAALFTPFRIVSALLSLGLLWTLYFTLVEPDPAARVRPLEVTSRLKLKDASRGLGPVRAGRTLVVYLYSDREPEAENNLRFFLRWGVGGPGDGCEYVIVAKHGEHHDLVSGNQFMTLKYGKVRHVHHNAAQRTGTLMSGHATCSPVSFDFQ